MARLLLVLLAGCSTPVVTDGAPATDSGSSDAAVPTLVASQGLPHAAPAVTLLVELGSDGYATVGGTVAGETWVDLDAPEDDTWAFRYQVLDASDRVLYERTLPGPIYVRDFLEHYSEETGYDILSVFPMLGRFPMVVPLLDGADRARLQVRGDDGSFANVGSYDLADATADDQGLSDTVIGSETLYESGPSDNRLDLVLVDDGFTADQQEEWVETADAITEALLENEPYASLIDYVNVHRVDAVSQESGASYDCVDACEARETAFGTVFPLNWVNALLGTDYDTRSVFQLQQWEVARAVATVPWDVVLVVSNTEKEGGMAVHFATVTTGLDNLGKTSVHELGHALGQLGDEYMSDACIRTDTLPVNVAEDPENPPWARWIEDETPLPTPEKRDYADVVGAFEGAYNCEQLYRPMLTCLMEDSDQGEFCPPCAEQMVRRILSFADPADGLDWSQDDDGARFTVDAPRELALEVRVGQDVVWSGTTAQTAVVPSADLAGRAGETLTVRASLDSDFVLEDAGELEQSWTFELAD